MNFKYVLILLLANTAMYSQSVQGIVRDQSGNAIELATITLNTTDSHVHSDEFGRYNLINVKIGDTLHISQMFYEGIQVIITDRTLKETIYSVLQSKNFELSQVIIRPEINAMKTISKIDLATNPVNNAQELLRRVPGLIIGQHAGGGKAEQIFLRGFDIDHGTDIHLSLDGLPINMVSHAHGQGYADMHFIIPEIIDQISYGKGPYDADKGNFATAGYVGIKTLDKPSQSMFTTEYGSFNTKRMAGVFKLMNTENEAAYLASEYLLSDGPFDASQNFNRINFFVKYTKKLENNDQLSVWASNFKSRWDASGQIPTRAVDQGLSRFGAIDNTEGGNTSRSNLYVQYSKFLSQDNFLKTRAYFSSYDFLLYSNFTFFLVDSVNGDQIRQKEKRKLYGLDTELNLKPFQKLTNFTLRAGAGLRHDDVDDVELSNTVNRKTTLNQLALGDVDETNLYGFVDTRLDLGKIQMNFIVRTDYFNFLYENRLSSIYNLKNENRTIISPKFNVTYTPNENVQLFTKLGKGFHSNDARVVLDQQADNILPAAYGIDLGGVFKAHHNFMVHVAFWYLYLEQEFVYVGDGGIVEPSGRTRRQGIDVGLRYQLAPWLFIYSDLNLAKPRSLDDAEGENLIPLAPLLTNTGGFSFNFTKYLNGGLRYRHIDARPANEDNSIVASGYTIFDLNLNYTFKKLVFGIEIQNIFNSDWNETQFATESRLRDEVNSVEEIHFTPGTPLFIKGKMSYLF